MSRWHPTVSMIRKNDPAALVPASMVKVFFSILNVLTVSGFRCVLIPVFNFLPIVVARGSSPKHGGIVTVEGYCVKKKLFKPVVFPSFLGMAMDVAMPT